MSSDETIRAQLAGVQEERDDLVKKLADAERRAEAAGMRWPQSLSTLEAALSTFPAGRVFLRQWTDVERDTACAARSAGFIEGTEAAAAFLRELSAKWDQTLGISLILHEAAMKVRALVPDKKEI